LKILPKVLILLMAQVRYALALNKDFGTPCHKIDSPRGESIGSPNGLMESTPLSKRL